MQTLNDGRYLTQPKSKRQVKLFLWVEVAGDRVKHGGKAVPLQDFLASNEVVPDSLSDDAWQLMDTKITRAIVAAGKAARACPSLAEKLAKHEECRALQEQQLWHRLGRFDVVDGATR